MDLIKKFGIGFSQRSIKFRGLAIDGDWVIGNLSYTNSKSIAGGDIGTFISNEAGSPFAHHVRSETVTQFAGITDKVATPVFEGDILCFKYDYDEAEVIKPFKKRFICSFFDGEFVLFNTISSRCEGYIDSGMATDMMVIGNVFEHPGLIFSTAK